MQIIIHSSMHFHVLFSVRKKDALIGPEWADHLYDQMRETLEYEQCVPMAFGGTADHVHLLFEMYPLLPPDELINRLKRKAQLWINDHKLTDAYFEWQDGYALFGSDSAGCASIADYIARQAEVHLHESHCEEFRRLLIENGIEFEEEGLPHEPE